ncbi:hypothetical protein K9M79_03095 [Candidatus Woesearchaeota archaeon]|nr:hypothetical protein [Candidatus Woesearchaeota archaeon]
MNINNGRTIQRIVILCILFLLGYGLNLVYPINFQATYPSCDYTQDINVPAKDGLYINGAEIINSAISEKPSPYDRVKQEDIHVYDDRVIIKIDNPEWAYFVNTNSMDPLLDVESNAIQIVPDKPEDIHVGDVISYESHLIDSTVIHRVVEVSFDEKGWYAMTKGDNNMFVDPDKIRFDDVKRILIAVIY